MDIYVDVLFGINFLFDFILLCITGYFLKMHPKIIRNLISAVFGAFAGVFLFLAPLSKTLTYLLFFLSSVIMILIAFGMKRNFRKTVKSLIAFYLVTCLLGSILFGILFMTNIGLKANASFRNGLFYMNISTRTLILLLATAVVLLKTIQTMIERWSKKAPLYVSVSIYQNNKHTCFFAMVDTGNSLYDPFNHKPVIVAEQNALKEVLDMDTVRFIKQASIDHILSPPEDKLHMIPFHSLGTQSGFLWGFTPDKITIQTPQKKTISCDAVIGIYPGQISHHDNYKALMHPELIQI